jgi:hypothetical protein
MMHGIKDRKLRLARGVQNFQHVGNAVVGFGNGFDVRPDLAAFGDEVVIRIDHQQRGDALVVGRGIHGGPPAGSRIVPIW